MRKSLQDIHNYWNNPDKYNKPELYVKKEANAKSAFLYNNIKQYITKQTTILDIGCNSGRNLNYLYNLGYKNLTGIEINKEAVLLMQKTYPKLFLNSKIINLPVEIAIKGIADNKHDLIFTMATLEHIHPDSAWVFTEMIRICNGYIVTIEDEETNSPRHFPRNYYRIFGGQMEQIAKLKASDYVNLPRGFVLRVFKKVKK